MPYVYRRSDGTVESLDGNFAVTMNYFTGIIENVKFFTYRPNITRPEMRIEWNESDKLCLFSFDIASGLIHMNYARWPTDEEIQWANETLAPTPDPTPAPAPAPDPAPVKPAPAAPAKPAPDPSPTAAAPWLTGKPNDSPSSSAPLGNDAPEKKG